MFENDRNDEQMPQKHRTNFLTTTQDVHVEPSAAVLSHIHTVIVKVEESGRMLEKRAENLGDFCAHFFRERSVSARKSRWTRPAEAEAQAQTGTDSSHSSHTLGKRQHSTHASNSASYLIRPAPFPTLFSRSQSAASFQPSPDGRSLDLDSLGIHHCRHSQCRA